MPATEVVSIVLGQPKRVSVLGHNSDGKFNGVLRLIHVIDKEGRQDHGAHVNKVANA